MKSYLGHIVDVVRHKVFDGELVVNEGRIVQVKPCELPANGKQYPYLMPGFIDSHVHIESSMMAPCEFARVAASHGTIGVVADPHEIGNVLGIEGVDYMIQSGKLYPFNYCFAAPSCVPSCSSDIETSGAIINAAGVEELMARDDIGVLGEMMNYPGVLNADPEVMRKIHAAQAHGKPVDGHAPRLVGNDRLHYALAGISTDHECATLDEGRSCISSGMKVIIREGSAAKDYAKLSPLIKESPNMVMFCTDDCHPDDLIRGHINLLVKRALSEGYDFWNIMMAASINAQRHYGLDWGMLQEGVLPTSLLWTRSIPTSGYYRRSSRASMCTTAIRRLALCCPPSTMMASTALTSIPTNLLPARSRPKTLFPSSRSTKRHISCAPPMVVYIHTMKRSR